MVPEGVDIAGLGEQLRQDGVAYSDAALAANDDVQRPVIQQLAEGHGIAVVDVDLENPADARDIATELQQASHLDTVIVQVPGRVSAVSETYSRAAIESAQAAIPPGADQVEVLSGFYSGVEHYGIPWGPIILAGILLLAAFMVAAFAWARRG